MVAEVRFCMHLRAICTVSAGTYAVLLCASFGSEVLLETHPHAFGITETVAFCKTALFVNHFGGVVRCEPPCDLPIMCEYLCAVEVRGDLGLYNTK